MFPFTKVPFWVPIFDPQPYEQTVPGLLGAAGAWANDLRSDFLQEDAGDAPQHEPQHFVAEGCCDLHPSHDPLLLFAGLHF